MGSLRIRRRLFSFCLFASIALLGMASLGIAPTAAQDDEGHPAHIHLGTCAELGEVAWALSNVGPGTVRNGTRSTNWEIVGQTSDVYPVDVSVTTVDVPLTTITDGTHAINIHESAENIQNYIACGNIGGTQYGNTLIIGLGEQNDANYSGIAVLRADGEQTVVTVYLATAEATTLDAAAPEDDETDVDDSTDEEAAPDNEAAPDAEAVSVAISGFAFAPNTLEIPAGTTVTWTNNDGAPHTVTADDGTFDSGRLDGGGTYSYTFDTPGTYAYHCDFHPNMIATVIVT